MGTFHVNGIISAENTISAKNGFIGNLTGNADTSSAIFYPSIISTDADLDNFLEAKKFKVGQYHGFTPTGSHISSNAIVLSGGYTNDSWGFQLAIDDDPTYKIQLRHKGGSNDWCDWKLIPMADGTNASGTWPINISGVSASTSRLNIIRILTGEGSHASNLKNEFDNYKNSIPRNELLTYRSNSYGNTSFYTGYFLHGYDDTPYGGFYVAHYNNPYYVGIINGTYTQQSILTDTNFTNWTVTKGGGGASGTWPISITGNAAYSPGASKLYSTDSSYSYTSGNPYYGYLTYNSPYWDFKVSPASPDDVRVSAAYTDNDGYPITGYQKEHIQSINLTNSSYNVNTWYPVLVSIPYNGMRRIACAVQLNSGSTPSWSTHSGGFTRILEMLVTAGGWGTTSAASICLQDYSAFGGDQSVGYSQFTNSSRACFWCRGGGIYRLITDFEANWTVYTSSTTISSQTVAPTTSYPGVSFAKSRIYANLTGDSIYGAVWNDYAEYRSTTEAKPGEVIIENGDGTLHKSHSRLEPGANVITDTFGFAIGETDQTKTPIAVAGRVLAYPYEDRYSYKPGAAVCSAPDGKISQMTREEMINYPDCIIGYVSEIPEYETWGTGNVDVDGRIWIKIK